MWALPWARLDSNQGPTDYELQLRSEVWLGNAVFGPVGSVPRQVVETDSSVGGVVSVVFSGVGTAV